MKLSKIILSLFCAATFIFSAVAFAACTAGGSTPPSGQNPSGGNGDTGNDDEETQEFSEITYNILYDNYYVDLEHKLNLDNHLYLTNDMKPIPYNFLRKQGHNVNAYLDDEKGWDYYKPSTLNCFASSYIYDNDKNHIYVSVKAENVSNSVYGNYYTSYLLKYPLTDKEYEEYNYLCKGGYLQGLLFIQELDNQKTPEIVNKINVQKETYNKMIIEYSQYKEINKNHDDIDIDIYSIISENDITISIRKAYDSNFYENTIGRVSFIPNYIADIKKYDNDVFFIRQPFQVNYKNLDEYQSSLQNITSFSYGTYIKHTNPYHVFDMIK